MALMKGRCHEMLSFRIVPLSLGRKRPTPAVLMTHSISFNTVFGRVFLIATRDLAMTYSYDELPAPCEGDGDPG